MKKITKKVTQEMVDEINKVREKCGFEPTDIKVGDEFSYYTKSRGTKK